MIAVDLATLEDIAQLCDLLEVLFSQEAEFVPDRPAQARGLKMILENPAVGHILAARQDGRVVGMVSLLYTVSTALGGKVAMLEDLVVAPGFRDQGLGSRLVARALELAHGQGCLRVTLLADAANHEAHRFYIRHAFVFSPMVPLRRLLPPL